jgi:hypothetical protein
MLWNHRIFAKNTYLFEIIFGTMENKSTATTKITLIKNSSWYVKFVALHVINASTDFV